MRGRFKWAKGAGHVNANPAADVEYPPKPKSQGFPVWTEDDLARYEARWPLGTKERVWSAVLLYTGLRRGDAVRIGWQHVRDSIASIRTEKSQGEIEVIIPILPDLQAALDAGPTGDLAFICGERGEPLVKESFGNMFSEAARKAGVRKSAHGVRHAQPTGARLWPNWKPFSAGSAAKWHHTTRARQIGRGSPAMRWQSSGRRTRLERL